MTKSTTLAWTTAYERAAAAARKAERRRIRQILELPEARRRWSFAIWIACATDATVDEASLRLRTEGLAQGTSAASTLADRMRGRFAVVSSTAPSPSPRPVADMPAGGGLVASMRSKFLKEGADHA